MGNMYEDFKTDTKLEKQGVVIQYGDSFQVTLARSGGQNTNFAKVLDRATKPYKRAIQTGTMGNAKSLEILREAYAKAVILNWEVNIAKDGEEPEWETGIESADGTMMEFNQTNVIDTLKALPDLFAAIQESADSSTLYREMLEEDDAKN